MDLSSITMKNATLLTLLTLFFTVFTAGCIDELVAVDQSADIPDISAYELDVFVNESTDQNTVINTTTFYLSNNASVRAVHMLVNTSMLDIIPPDDLNSNSDTPTNIIIIAGNANDTNASIELFTTYSRASSASDINYTLTKNVVFGQKQTYLTFNETITGFVAYTMSVPKGQDFAYQPTSDSTVRFVLPPEYTTGNPFIGTARPNPDMVYSDDEGRENLVWYDLDSKDTIIVKYYSKSAPRMLLIGGTILAIGTLIILASSHITQQRLKRIRDQIEEDADKKKNGKK